MVVVISDIDTAENFCWGPAFFGTGGGGRIGAGLDMLTPALRVGKKLTFVSSEFGGYAREARMR
jgi:hypothetical protein